MEELLLINPRKRTGARRKPRSAAQKRATAKMLAANRSRYRKNPIHHKARSRTPARSATPRLRARRKRNTVSGYFPNPHRRSYRRNPSSSATTKVMPLLKDSAIGAVGAIAVDALFHFLPIPVTWKTGTMANVAKGSVAVALGLFGHKLLPRGMAGKLAQGSLTVTMYDAIKAPVSNMFPTLGLGYYPGGMTTQHYPMMNAAPAPALSEYINSGMAGMDSLAAVDEYMGNTY